MLNQETKRKNIACIFLCIVAVAFVAYRLYQRELAVGAAVLIIYGVCMCFFSLHLQRLVADGKADPKRLRLVQWGLVLVIVVVAAAWCIGNAVLTVPQDDRHLSAVVNELQPGAAEEEITGLRMKRNTGYWAERDTFDFSNLDSIAQFCYLEGEDADVLYHALMKLELKPGKGRFILSASQLKFDLYLCCSDIYLGFTQNGDVYLFGEPELDSLVPANRFTLAGSGYVQVEALTAPYFSAA